MFNKITSTNVLKKLPLKNTAKRCIIGIEMAGIIGTASSTRVGEMAKTAENSLRPNVYSARKALKYKESADSIADINRALLAIREQAAIFKSQKSVVMKIMNEDENIAATADTTKLAEKIVTIAKKLDANPVHIACIAKEETHFTEHVSRGSGHGIMQITPIVAKDMFLRPSYYHEELEKITAKYKNHREFFKAIQKKTTLNIEVGTLLFQARLEETKGNVKNALMLYNGSSIKHSYASKIMADIKKYEKILEKRL